jgi:predicted nucleic acid-binding protein
MRILMDTSALYKRYNAEPGRAQVMAAGERASELVVAAHCKTEIASALNRQRLDGLVSADDYARIMRIVQDDFADFTLVALDGRVEAHAAQAMESSRLRATDALHIGAARAAHVDLFVTADRRQAQAAQALGLKTELIEV